ncbi:MAG: hypothetical protein LBK95_00640 [Bifidobacteriaceae bacterium]|jgi:hypothetical protein|nr:hypothetical protein [Bifidobacteriaceae bacterium]
MTVTQEAFRSLLAMMTPQIIERLAQERSLTIEQAAAALYTSRLYQALEDEESKAWHLSPLALTDLLEQELDTGEIVWPGETG